MAENIGPLYPTKIPGYEEAADIQAALKLYHYGTTTVPETESEIIANSVAGHLKSIQEELTALDEREESRGIGSDYTPTEPTDLRDGFIWVNSSSSPIATAINATAKYQDSEPSLELTQGMLWVDSDSSPLKLYVYSGSAWLEIGA